MTGPSLVDSPGFTPERGPAACGSLQAIGLNSDAWFLDRAQRPRLRAKHPSSASSDLFRRPGAKPDEQTRSAIELAVRDLAGGIEGGTQSRNRFALLGHLVDLGRGRARPSTAVGSWLAR